jgi:hypothetical protein
MKTAFSGDCPDPGEVPELIGVDACSLDLPRHLGNSGYNLVIDANMHLDSATRNFKGDIQTAGGSLDMTYVNAPHTRAQPFQPAGATVSATVATNVRTRIWEYGSNPQEALEGLCDVTNSESYFFGQPGLGDAAEDNTAGQRSRNACMMSGRGAQLPVQAKVGTAAWVDSTRIWAALAAGHPERVSLIDVVAFDCPDCEVASERQPSLDEPGWGMAASCLWNPGWSTFAAVSLAGANPASAPPTGPAPENLFCPATSEWGAGYSAVSSSYFFPWHLQCGEHAGWINADLRDCVEMTTADTPLRLANAPEHAVGVPGGSAGRVVRAEVVAALPLRDGATSCSVAKAMGTGDDHPGLDDNDNPDPYTLTGPALGRLLFLDHDHRLLDENGTVVFRQGVPLAPGCEDDWPLSANDIAAVRPKFNPTGQTNVFVSTSGVVPPNAKYVAALFEIPNASDSFQPTWFPNASSVVYSLQSFDGPDTSPGMSPIDVETMFGASALPFAERADLPTSCNDRRWFRSAAWMAAESSPSGCYSTAAASPE